MTTKRLHFAVTKSHGLMPVPRPHFSSFKSTLNSKPNSRIESIRIEVIFGEVECTKLPPPRCAVGRRRNNVAEQTAPRSRDPGAKTGVQPLTPIQGEPNKTAAFHIY